MSEVVVVGGCVVDTIYKASTASATVSTMVGTSTPCNLVRRSYGGVGRNVAEALARLDVKVKLLSVVGEDQAGDDIVKQCMAFGIDASGVLRVAGCSTASYTAILDGAGELVSASADMKIFDAHLATGTHLAEIRRQLFPNDAARYIIIDGNVPQDGIESIVNMVVEIKRRRLGPAATSTDFPRLVFEPISREKAVKAQRVLRHFALVKPNHLELEVLSRVFNPKSSEKQEKGSGQARSIRQCAVEQATHLITRTGVHAVLCTCGASGSVYADATASTEACGGGSSRLTAHEFDAPSLAGMSVAKVTGAGDSFLAGFVFGQLLELSVRDSVVLANKAAKLALTTHVISPDLSRKTILADLQKAVGSSHLQSRL